MNHKILFGAVALCLVSTAHAQPPRQAPDPNAQAMPAPAVVPLDAQPANPNVPYNPNARPGSNANPVVVGGNETPPPPPQDHYPVCKGAVQDRCISPRETSHATKHKEPMHHHKAPRHKKRN